MSNVLFRAVSVSDLGLISNYHDMAVRLSTDGSPPEGYYVYQVKVKKVRGGGM